MYNDINLPEDEAWTAMTTDLRRTKEEKNELQKENSCVWVRLSLAVRTDDHVPQHAQAQAH